LIQHVGSLRSKAESQRCAISHSKHIPAGPDASKLAPSLIRAGHYAVARIFAPATYLFARNFLAKGNGKGRILQCGCYCY